jgi:hypothetical protein
MNFVYVVEKKTLDSMRKTLFSMKMAKIIFNSWNQKNLIYEALVQQWGLNTIEPLDPYPLGLLYKDVELQVACQCLFNFFIYNEFIDKLKCDVVLLDTCDFVLGNVYLWDRDVIFLREPISVYW